MNGTAPDGPAPFSSVTAAHANVAVTNAVAAAKDLPDLVNKLQVVDPALAQQLEGKALAASTTPIGTFLVPALAWLAAHYGLGWDATTCSMVAGALVLIGTYAMRYVTTSPIAGIFSKGATPAQQAAVPAVAKAATP